MSASRSPLPHSGPHPGAMVERRRLELIQVTKLQAVSDMLDRAGGIIELARIDATRRLAATIYAWGERIPTQEVRCPRDWWQAVRERWLPQWWLKRHPVVYQVHTMDAAALFPDFWPKQALGERYIYVEFASYPGVEGTASLAELDETE